MSHTAAVARWQAGAVALILLVSGPFPQMSAASVIAGTLTVSGESWIFVSPQLPPNMVTNLSRTLFATPGDLNADGRDDLLVWLGNGSSIYGSFYLVNGSADGLDQ